MYFRSRENKNESKSFRGRQFIFDCQHFQWIFSSCLCSLLTNSSISQQKWSDWNANLFCVRFFFFNNWVNKRFDSFLCRQSYTYANVFSFLKVKRLRRRASALPFSPRLHASIADALPPLTESEREEHIQIRNCAWDNCGCHLAFPCAAGIPGCKFRSGSESGLELCTQNLSFCFRARLSSAQYSQHVSPGTERTATPSVPSPLLNG